MREAMKTLYLLRHAKSSWRDASLDDFDRPLAPRGKRTAPVMGDFILSHLELPDLVLCSAATRARATYELASASWPRDVTVKYDRALYHAGPNDLQKRLTKVAEGVDRVMIVGHNPALHHLAIKLTFGGDPEAMEKLRHKFPTAALAEIELEGDDWRNFDPIGGRLVRFVLPRDLQRT
jgi:phosphohistidine phosphatase